MRSQGIVLFGCLALTGLGAQAPRSGGNPLALPSAPSRSGAEFRAAGWIHKQTDSFSLLVNGYATGRSLTQMEFQFTGVSGENVAGGKVTVNVEPTFTAWYQGTTSQPSGSQFTATVPFTLTGDVKAAATRVDAIQSVAVTISNRQGSPASVSANVK